VAVMVAEAEAVEEDLVAVGVAVEQDWLCYFKHNFVNW